MSALISRARAMDPGARLLFGYQAFCTHDATPPDLLFVDGRFQQVTWIGEWQETWIAAMIEAKAHNVSEHGAGVESVALPLDEIVADPGVC